MPNNGITALMGVGAAILLTLGIYSLVFPSTNFEETNIYGIFGYFVGVSVFVAPGGFLIYLFFKRTRKTPHIKA